MIQTSTLKYYFTLIFILCFFYSKAQNINIPDVNFKKALVDNKEINTNNDGEISKSESEAITGKLDVSYKEISDLTGIEYFINLKELVCRSNSLVQLDVSNNKLLEMLDCMDNKLNQLMLPENKLLKKLNCSHNNLRNLDVSAKISLTELSCVNNILSSLDLGKNSKLVGLYCSENQLNALDLKGCKDLVRLDCSDNPLNKLDLKDNVALNEISCQNNGLSNLDVSKNILLSRLTCSNNKLTKLDVSNNKNLQDLSCNNNQLINLDVTKNTALEALICAYNKVSYLDLSKNKVLSWLPISNNELITIKPYPNAKYHAFGDFIDNNRLTFSELQKIKPNISSKYYYNSTKRIFKPIVAVYDFRVNYSIESSFEGHNTTFIWYNDKGNVVDESFVKEQSTKGIFRFLRPGIYHCKMTNSAFPKTELITETITINKTVLDIPDKKFKEFLLENKSINTDGDDEILLSESASITGMLDLSGKKIVHLTGIEHFTNISGLNCSDNELNSLDVSKNSKLSLLNCNNNKFPFSVLKRIKDSYSKLSYTSNKKIFLPIENVYGYEVDYSTETAINGNATSFTWYDKNGNIKDQNFVEEQNTSGIFKFINANLYHCKMINASFPGLELVTETITIKTKKQTVAFNNLSATAKVKDVVHLSATASSGLAVRYELVSGNANLSGNSLTFNQEGTVIIKAIQDGNVEFAPTEQTVTIKVTKKAQHISFTNIPTTTKVIDVIHLSATASSNLPVRFELVSGSASLNGNALTPNQEGTIIVKAIQAGNVEFAPAEQTATIKVTKKTQNVSFSNLSTNVKVKDVVQLSGTSSSGLAVRFELVSGSASLEGNALTLHQEGVVTVKAIQDGNVEFTPAEKTASINVTKKDQNISFKDLSTSAKVKDVIQLSAISSSGLAVRFELVSGSASLEGNALTLHQEGVVTVKAIQGGNVEFTPAEKTASINVTKKDQNISFKDLSASAKVKDAIQLSAISSSGLTVQFELISGNASLKGSELTFNQEGSVAVKAIQDGNAEFSATEQTAIIKVSKKDQSIKITNLSLNAKVNDAVQLSATASSGLTVHFELVEGDASLTGNALTFNREGIVIIKAIQDGNIEYSAVEETVDFQVTGDGLSKSSVTIYPNPFVNELNIKFKNSERKTISIYNLTGKLQYQTEAFVTKRLDLSDFPSGMYIMKIQSGGIVYNSKILKR